MSTTSPAPVNSDKSKLSEAHFVQIPNVLLNQVAEGGLQPLDVLVFGVLHSHLGQNEAAWPSNTTVAKCLGKGVATVGRSISRLTKRGHIRREQNDRGDTARTYFLTGVKDGQVSVGKPAPPAIAPPKPVAVVTDSADDVPPF